MCTDTFVRQLGCHVEAYPRHQNTYVKQDIVDAEISLLSSRALKEYLGVILRCKIAATCTACQTGCNMH